MDQEELARYQQELVKVDMASQWEIRQQKLIQKLLKLIGDPRVVAKNFLTPGQRTKEFTVLYNQIRKQRIDEDHIKTVEQLLNVALLFMLQSRLDISDFDDFERIYYSFLDDAWHFKFNETASPVKTFLVKSQKDANFKVTVRTRLDGFVISFLNDNSFRIVSVPKRFEFLRAGYVLGDQTFATTNEFRKALIARLKIIDSAKTLADFKSALNLIDRYFVNGLVGFALSINLTEDVGKTLQDILQRTKNVEMFEELNNPKVERYLNSVWEYLRVLKMNGHFDQRVLSSVLSVEQLKKLAQESVQTIDYSREEELLRPILWQSPQESQYYIETDYVTDSLAANFVKLANKLFHWKLKANQLKKTERVVIPQLSFDGKGRELDA